MSETKELTTIDLLRQIEPLVTWLGLYETSGVLRLGSNVWFDYKDLSTNKDLQFRLLGAICADCDERDGWTYKSGSVVTGKGWFFQIFSFGLNELPVHMESEESMCHAALLAYRDALGAMSTDDNSICSYCGDDLDNHIRCEHCGYTECDKEIHGDHHLCNGTGRAGGEGS